MLYTYNAQCDAQNAKYYKLYIPLRSPCLNYCLSAHWAFDSETKGLITMATMAWY